MAKFLINARFFKTLLVRYRVLQRVIGACLVFSSKNVKSPWKEKHREIIPLELARSLSRRAFLTLTKCEQQWILCIWYSYNAEKQEKEQYYYKKS